MVREPVTPSQPVGGIDVPRLVIAAPNSSSGKTTVSIGLMAALTARGTRVAGFKVGPDYIDPGYHTLATGRPGRNLDAWLCGVDRIAGLLAHGMAECDVALIEGVMGLFDGRLGVTDGVRGFGSSAHIASLTRSPVLLVLDCSGVSRTLAATALGLATHPDAPPIAGVIWNKAGSQRAQAELRDAFEQVQIPVFGALPRDLRLDMPSRHLGLVPATEADQAREFIAAAARLVADHVDLDAVLGAARSADPLDAEPWRPDAEVTRVAGRPRVAIAGGRAFTFRYAETTELLAAAGCEIVEFDPLVADRLPARTHALYLGGGFPEVFADELAANRPLLADIRAAVAAGLPTVAECAGLLYLCHSLDGVDMVGAIPCEGRFSERLTLGYRDLRAAVDSVVAREGESVRSHEFHRTVTRSVADELATGEPLSPAWVVDSDDDGEGIAGPRLLASYQHVHWAGNPCHAQRFAQAASDFAASQSGWQVDAGLRREPEHDLRYHGDQAAQSGQVNLAVNVWPAPEWLLDDIAVARHQWQSYPDVTQATRLLARHHGLTDDQVLVTAGGADAFTLIARCLAARHALVIHPQFTEPEQALRVAGHRVRRLLLRPEEGFRLRPERVTGNVELIVIGNPTNPTGTLHSAEAIRSLVRPGRIVLVDEAFMDFVPGEAESLLRPGSDLTGLLVVRSATKMWGLPGLRAGYLAGDRRVVAELACHQEPWPVSRPALDALRASCDGRARDHVAWVVGELERDRDFLVESLRNAGLTVAGDPRTPFVLVDVSNAGIDAAANRLANLGFAVRDCSSFPGLDDRWLRLRVPDRATSVRLMAALRKAATT